MPVRGAAQGCVTCVNSVFSMQPQCLHSLHPVASSPSKDLSACVLACSFLPRPCPAFCPLQYNKVGLKAGQGLETRLTLSTTWFGTPLFFCTLGLPTGNYKFVVLLYGILLTRAGHMTIQSIHASQLQAFLSNGIPVPCCLDKTGFSVL